MIDERPTDGAGDPLDAPRCLHEDHGCVLDGDISPSEGEGADLDVEERQQLKL